MHNAGKDMVTLVRIAAEDDGKGITGHQVVE